jgi:hypothetical protein
MINNIHMFIDTFVHPVQNYVALYISFTGFSDEFLPANISVALMGVKCYRHSMGSCSWITIISDYYIRKTIVKAILHFYITVICTVAGQMMVLVDCLLFDIYKPNE